MQMKLSPLAAVVAAVTVLSPLAAGAQTQPPSSTAAPAAAPAPKAQVSDQQITKAAVAMGKVMNIRQTYNQKLTQAKPEDRGRIADESQAAMQKAVTDQGLSVEQYNAILQLAQNDPGVREKLMSRLPQENGETTGSSPSKP
ncbi:MAG: DUF4168 domain-containing protein [Alphaproteobacteria bacterium]|nr:DUF4168 domain-containing protein [Alphaproteobacteria bacterium]MDE1931489.1 DUF4168 domain-containing protein [Alphaproteobacteria bacterium]